MPGTTLCLLAGCSRSRRRGMLSEWRHRRLMPHTSSWDFKCAGVFYICFHFKIQMRFFKGGLKWQSNKFQEPYCSECSQELESCPGFYQNTDNFFLSFVSFPHPPLYCILPPQQRSLYTAIFFKINVLVNKLQEPGLQMNGNDGAKHFLVSGQTANYFIQLVLMSQQKGTIHISYRQPSDWTKP